MTNVLYIYSKCSTCQKALAFLEQRKVLFQRKEITETPPSREELLKMLFFKNGDLKKLFNTSGMLYRELNLSARLPQMSQEEALGLLEKNGMLVKRPFFLSPTFGCLGFREPEWLGIMP